MLRDGPCPAQVHRQITCSRLADGVKGNEGANYGSLWLVRLVQCAEVQSEGTRGDAHCGQLR